MKLFGERQQRRPRLEILPMIDVMLLLLVYYILSTISLGHEHGIPVKLPQASTGEAATAATHDLTITITRDGEYFVDKDKIRPDDLAATVKAVAARTPGGVQALQTNGVVINADLTVQHRLVVTTMDTLREIGVTQFSIATDSESHKP